MKQEYKNFGGLVNIEGVAKLTTLGQSVLLERELAADTVAGGGCILPADVFDDIGFTKEEIQKYPTPGDAVRAPHAFLLKRDEALERWKEFRAEGQRADVPVSELKQDGFDGE